MKRNVLSFSAWLLLFGALLVGQAQAQTAKEVMEKMLAACKTVNTCTYTQKKWERVGGKLIEGKLTVKWSRSPYRIWVYNHYPNDGVKVLYVSGQNGNKALVNPGAWLPNLTLDPYGSQMRKDQHHTIFASGFDHLANIITGLKNKYAANIDKHLVKEADVVWNGRSCYKIVMSTTSFGYTNYTVQSGENLLTIAKKLNLSEHMISEANGNMDYYGAKAGQVIKVPTEYAAKAIFYIDKANNLPIVNMIFDDKGMYEKYEFYDLKINPTLSSSDFTVD